VNEAESLKVVLGSIFSRRGSETAKTKLFDNLSSQVQADLLDEVSLCHGELPVLASISTGEPWLLITTAHLFWKKEGNITVIDLSQLKDATVKIGLDAKKKTNPKDGLTCLTLILKSGREHVIETEPGFAHVGIWNVLKHFGVINTKS